MPLDSVAKRLTAQRLVGKGRELLVLRRFLPAASAAVPWRPVADDPSVQDYPDVPVFLIPVNGSDPTVQYADGSESKVSDMEGYLAAEDAPVPLELGMVILRANGEKLAVKLISKFDPGGTVIFYRFWASA